MNELLIALGAHNGRWINLSQVAEDRLICAYNFYCANNNFKVVCAIGLGQHFYITDRPHFYYAKKHLIDRGIPADAFLNCPPSSNTIEDFQMTKDLVLEEQPDILVILTSDFHLSRARALYYRIINYSRVVFIPAPSSLPEEQLLPLLAHEASALKKLNEVEPI